MATKEERGGLALAFAGVGEQIRMLIYFATHGVCPFCFAMYERDSPLVTGAKRGLVGDKLKAFTAAARKQDADDGIDSETGHALDCTLPPEMK